MINACFFLIVRIYGEKNRCPDRSYYISTSLYANKVTGCGCGRMGCSTGKKFAQRGVPYYVSYAKTVAEASKEKRKKKSEN